jgi:ABC-type nitrate/sulfonate/bicarbonate transport system permease component
MSRAQLLRSLIAPLLLILVWQAWASQLPVRHRVPTPARVLEAAYELIVTGQLPLALGQSLLRVIAGFVVAAMIALLLGLLMGYFRAVGRNIDPVVESFRPIAPIAFLPLAILWFGTGTPAAVFIVAYAAFFPIIVNTIHGVRSVDQSFARAALTMGVRRATILRTVILPGALPQIFTGARLGMGVAWTSIIAAELAVGAKAGSGGSGGIGQMMFVFYAYSVELNSIVVCMISVGLIALTIDRGLLWLQRRSMPWIDDKP